MSESHKYDRDIYNPASLNPSEIGKEALIQNSNKGRKQKRQQKKDDKKWRGRVPGRHVHAPRIRANGPWRARARPAPRPASHARAVMRRPPRAARAAT